jgi:hypothetical protein
MDGSKLVRRSFEYITKNLNVSAELSSFSEKIRRQIQMAVRARFLNLRVVDYMFSVPWVSKGHVGSMIVLENLLALQADLVRCHAQLHACKSLQRRPLVTALTLAEILWHGIPETEWPSIREV